MQVVEVPVPDFIRNRLVSYKSTLIGILGIILATVKIMHEPSLSVAFHDPAFQMEALFAIYGFVTKDASVTGGQTPATLEAKKRLTDFKTEEKLKGEVK